MLIIDNRYKKGVFDVVRQCRTTVRQEHKHKHKQIYQSIVRKLKVYIMWIEEVRHTKDSIKRDLNRIEIELGQLDVLMRECQERSYSGQIMAMLVNCKLIKEDRMAQLRIM